MSKLNLEKKAEIVAHYLNTSDGYTNTANIFGISESVVKMLVAQFKANGIEGLTHKNGTYSGDFKLHVLEYQKQHNLSDKETAVLFKIPMLCFRSSLSSFPEKENTSYYPPILYRCFIKYPLKIWIILKL